MSTARSKLIWFLFGIVMGSLIVGVPSAIRILGLKHHYQKLNTFFRGSVNDVDIEGVGYFDYFGFGFMEGEQWKVQLVNRRAGHSPMIIYQNRYDFQESIPHQPTVKIVGDHVLIDDGEINLAVTVTNRAKQNVATKLLELTKPR